MILFVGLNDWMIRNLLRSSFPGRSKELGLRLHGLVYDVSHPIYQATLRDELGMESEPQGLVKEDDLALPSWVGQLTHQIQLLQACRTGNKTFHAWRLRRWDENGRHPLRPLKYRVEREVGNCLSRLPIEERLVKEYFQVLERSRYVEQHCISKLRSLDPDLVVSGSPETFYDKPWLVAAGRLGIPRAVWVRSWDNFSTKMSVYSPAEHYFLWSPQMAEEFRLYFPYFRTTEARVIGSTQFDGHATAGNVMSREDFCATVGLDPVRPIVLYTTAGPHICRDEHLVIKRVIEGVDGLAMEPRPQFLIRLHPYYWGTDLDVYNHIAGVAVWPRKDEVEKMKGGSTTGLLDDYRIMLSSFFHQAVNLNVASTVTLDCAIFDKPVVNIAFEAGHRSPEASIERYYTDFDHYVRVVESKAAEVAWSVEDCVRLTERALKCPGAREKERKALVQYVCGEVDGLSGKRLADAIAEAARAGHGRRVS